MTEPQKPPDEPGGIEDAFTVVLARRGRSFTIEPGRTILETLLENDLDVAFSCMQGICGTCEVRVLEGVPDHRDEILSDAERAENRTMMICCSRSKTPVLVLDV